MSTPRAVVAARLFWDLRIMLDGPPRTDGAVTAIAEKHAVGCAGGIAIPLARAGWDVTIVSWVGGDDEGAAVLRELDEYGIDTTFIRRVPQVRTCASTVLSHGGLRTLIKNPAASEGDAYTDPGAHDLIRDVDLVCVYAANPFTAEFARSARSAGVFCSADVGDRPERVCDEAVKNADLIVGHADAILGITGTDDNHSGAAALISNGASHVAFTDGANGSSVHTPDGAVVTQAAVTPPNGTVVDVCGAGDAYHSTLAGHLAVGLDPATAAVAAAAASAEVIGVLGHPKPPKKIITRSWGEITGW